MLMVLMVFLSVDGVFVLAFFFSQIRKNEKRDLKGGANGIWFMNLPILKQSKSAATFTKTDFFLSFQ